MDIEKHEKPEMKILQWNAVALWSWATTIENCAICKELLSDPCPLCMEDSDIEESEEMVPKPKIECPPVWSACNHPFHNHCIEQWLDKHKKCPLCTADWIYKNKDVKTQC